MASKQYPRMLDRSIKSYLMPYDKLILMTLISMTPIGSNRCSLTTTEISEILSASKNTVLKALRALGSLGLIRTEYPKRNQAIRIIDEERVMQLGNRKAGELLFTDMTCTIPVSMPPAQPTPLEETPDPTEPPQSTEGGATMKPEPKPEPKPKARPDHDRGPYDPTAVPLEQLIGHIRTWAGFMALDPDEVAHARGIEGQRRILSVKAAYGRGMTEEQINIALLGNAKGPGWRTRSVELALRDGVDVKAHRAGEEYLKSNPAMKRVFDEARRAKEGEAARAEAHQDCPLCGGSGFDSGKACVCRARPLTDAEASEGRRRRNATEAADQNCEQCYGVGLLQIPGRPFSTDFEMSCTPAACVCTGQSDPAAIAEVESRLEEIKAEEAADEAAERASLEAILAGQRQEVGGPTRKTADGDGLNKEPEPQDTPESAPGSAPVCDDAPEEFGAPDEQSAPPTRFAPDFNLFGGFDS